MSEASRHAEKLLQLCRTCGDKLNQGRFKCIGLYRNEILSLLGLDVSNDNPDVHPNRVCIKCYKRLDRYKQSKLEGKHFQPFSTPLVPTFHPHSIPCTLCSKPKNVGGRPAKKRRNVPVSDTDAGPSSTPLQESPTDFDVQPSSTAPQESPTDFDLQPCSTASQDQSLVSFPGQSTTQSLDSPDILVEADSPLGIAELEISTNVSSPLPIVNVKTDSSSLTSTSQQPRRSLFSAKAPKQSLLECDRWYLKTKRLKSIHDQVNEFCIKNKESKGDVLHVLLKEHLLETGQKDKANAFNNIMCQTPTTLDVDQCLAIRVNQLQTKNEYKYEYEKINKKTGQKILQAPYVLDMKEKSYVPPASRWSLIGQEYHHHVHHTPAKIQTSVANSSRGLDFEPVDIVSDFHASLPEIPKPNCKGCRWNYIDAVAKTLEELETVLTDGLSSHGLSTSDDSTLFTVVVKDGADGMGDVERHMEKSDSYLPDKAFRFAFAIVSISVHVDGEDIVIFREPSPSSTRVNRPLLVAIADENYKSSCVVCMVNIEHEREFMKGKLLKVHIPESGLHRLFALKFFSSMIDEKFDRSEGGLQVNFWNEY